MTRSTAISGPVTPPRPRPRSASSPRTTCSKEPAPSSRNAHPSTTAGDGRHRGPSTAATSRNEMSDVSRFGVFLPSYVWEGDGDERARGIRRFAQTVEDLGFDSLFITDHLLVGKRFYSVNWLEPILSLAVAAGVTGWVRRGTSMRIMP